jgi:hypothetical protein
MGCLDCPSELREATASLIVDTTAAGSRRTPQQQVLAAARFRKGLGYEVRSRNTNARTPAGKRLIPCAFPTLSPKSTQLYQDL